MNIIDDSSDDASSDDASSIQSSDTEELYLYEAPKVVVVIPESLSLSSVAGAPPEDSVAHAEPWVVHDVARLVKAGVSRNAVAASFHVMSSLFAAGVPSDDLTICAMELRDLTFPQACGTMARLDSGDEVWNFTRRCEI